MDWLEREGAGLTACTASWARSCPRASQSKRWRASSVLCCFWLSLPALGSGLRTDEEEPAVQEEEPSASAYWAQMSAVLGEDVKRNEEGTDAPVSKAQVSAFLKRDQQDLMGTKLQNLRLEPDQIRGCRGAGPAPCLDPVIAEAWGRIPPPRSRERRSPGNISPSIT